MKNLLALILVNFLIFNAVDAQNLQQTERNSEDVLKEAIADFDGKRFEKCLSALNLAIGINHNGELSDILYYYRALTYLKLNQEKEALSDLDTAIIFNDKKTNYLTLRSDIKMDMFMYTEAMSDIEKALYLEPSNETALLNKAIIVQEWGQIHKALELYNDILVANPNQTLALYLRGILYLQNQMPEKGCADIKEAVSKGSKEATEAFNRYCK